MSKNIAGVEILGFALFMTVMKLFTSILLFTLPVFSSGAATYYWTSGGDGVSVYVEANWTENADGSGGTIPQINGNTAVNHDLIVNAGNPGGGGGAGATLDLGSGSLTINAGTFKMLSLIHI